MNSVNFLASVGGKRPISAADYVASLSMLDVDQHEKAALADRDADRLASLLGGRDDMKALIIVPAGS